MSDTYYAGSSAIRKNYSGINRVGIKFLIFMPIFLYVFCWAYKQLSQEQTWIPVLASAIIYFFVGIYFGCTVNYNEFHFLIGKRSDALNRISYSYFYNPVGKYPTEIEDAVKKRFVAGGYKRKGKIKMSIYLSIGLVMCIVACCFDIMAIMTTIIYPLTYLFSFIFYSVGYSGYLDTIFPKGNFGGAITWQECICPNCGAICSPRDTVTSNYKSRVDYQIGTERVQDRYTFNGGTIYGSHNEMTIDETHSYSHEEHHHCIRCGNNFSKRKDGSYSKRIY